MFTSILVSGSFCFTGCVDVFFSYIFVVDKYLSIYLFVCVFYFYMKEGLAKGKKHINKKPDAQCKDWKMREN